MNEEEKVATFTLIPENKFNSNNPGTILFGRDIDTDDYVLEKDKGKDDRLTETRLRSVRQAVINQAITSYRWLCSSRGREPTW